MVHSKMCILYSDYPFIRQLNTDRLVSGKNIGGQPLKNTMTFKQRKELESKLSKTFKENLKGLSAELQGILLDDMVTAFQNRIIVLMRAQKKGSY
jgi:hypothetical protein